MPEPLANQPARVAPTIPARTSDKSSTSGQTIRVAIVVLSPIGLSSIGSILDALDRANCLDGHTLYQWSMHSADGKPLLLTGGVQWPVDGPLAAASACDWAFVLSEHYVENDASRRFRADVARLAQRTKLMCGIHEGVWWLADAGLLNGYRVAVHRGKPSAFR